MKKLMLLLLTIFYAPYATCMDLGYITEYFEQTQAASNRSNSSNEKGKKYAISQEEPELSASRQSSHRRETSISRSINHNQIACLDDDNRDIAPDVDPKRSSKDNLPKALPTTLLQALPTGQTPRSLHRRSKAGEFTDIRTAQTITNSKQLNNTSTSSCCVTQ